MFNQKHGYSNFSKLPEEIDRPVQMERGMSFFIDGPGGGAIPKVREEDGPPEYFLMFP